METIFATLEVLGMHGVVYGLISIIAIILAASWRKHEGDLQTMRQELKNALERCDKEREAVKTDMMDRWVRDAETYVTKDDFNSLGAEIKATLVRIEDKIEKLRSRN